MTFAMLVLLLLCVLLCFLASRRAGIALRTVWFSHLVRLLARVYCFENIRDGGTIYWCLRCSTWLFGSVICLGIFWVLVTLVGLLFEVDVMFAIAEAFSRGLYSDPSVSSVWQFVAFISLLTNYLTNEVKTRD